jgi:hypothetical protein
MPTPASRDAPSGAAESAGEPLGPFPGFFGALTIKTVQGKGGAFADSSSWSMPNPFGQKRRDFLGSVIANVIISRCVARALKRNSMISTAAL